MSATAEPDVKPEGPMLMFADSFTQDGLKLFELPPDVVKAMEGDETITIRGSGEQPLVLVTKSHTYELRRAETSNTLLVTSVDVTSAGSLSSAPDQVPVLASASCTYELIATHPRVWQLQDVMRAHTVSTWEAEGPKGVSFDVLRAHVQASDTQLMQALHEQGACEHEGSWVLFSPHYTARVFTLLLSYIVENDWPIHSVPHDAMCSTVPHVPVWHVHHVMSCFAEERLPAEGKWRLSADQIAMFRAKELFGAYTGVDAQAPVRDHSEAVFMQEWANNVPGGVHVSVEMLKGVALRTRIGATATLQYFPSDRLSLLPDQRFLQLFAARHEWLHEDLVPYIKPLLGFGVTETKLLLKYCRMSTKDGVRVYSMR